MIFIRKVRLPQLTGNKKRRAYIYIPDMAAENPDMRFPVLYMFDGHNVFFDSHATYGKSWGMLEFLQQSNAPLIVAAVECNHGPNNERLMEYTPFDFEDPYFGFIKAKGKATMDWFVNYFKPYVDSHFPTMPQREYTFISGSSMGGLMTLYALSRYNHIFGRGAALSPSVSFSNRELLGMINHSHYGSDTVLYMDYGQQEFMDNRGEMADYNRVASALVRRGVLLNSRIVPMGEHTEASWERQIPTFMETLFYNL